MSGRCVLLFVGYLGGLTFLLLVTSTNRYLLENFNDDSVGAETNYQRDDYSNVDPSENSDDSPAELVLTGAKTVLDTENVLDYDPAPRTSAIPYNFIDSSVRYFLYSPSGGLSNQLLEVAYALEIARILNRTLYLPMIGRHSSGWKSHEALEYTDLFPMDRILDFSRLAEKVPVVPLNMSVNNFAALYITVRGENRARIVYHPKREYWTKNMLVAKLGSERRKLVYLRGADMWQQWFPIPVMIQVRKFIRFSQPLRKRALEIVKKAFPDRRFNAMHIRLSDYTDRWGTYQQRARAVSMKPYTDRFGPNKEKMNISLPLYLASDEPNNGAFVDLKRKLNVITIQRLPQELLEAYKNLFPKSRIRNDMAGVLEQLICAQAICFSGTDWSTFSENILFIRASKAKLFPELAQQQR